ncbi:MAG TPA: hypothetical protein VGG64_11745 [Pirellulales bacterium]|jgi:hypothetical protein|nr:hypothetical protein [Pirellulales bacterium]
MKSQESFPFVIAAIAGAVIGYPIAGWAGMIGTAIGLCFVLGGLGGSSQGAKPRQRRR